MDRFRLDEWSFESNQGSVSKESGLNVYNNSFLSIQNNRAGIAYEFHTYEALKLIDPEHQISALNNPSTLQSNITKYCKPAEEVSSCSSYIGQVKLSYRHGSILIEDTSDHIPLEKLTKNDPILWFNEIKLFNKGTLKEKSDFSIKVRVMPTMFYCLAKMTLFLSRKTVRSLETRVFHEYGSDSILRVFCVKENSIDDLANKGLLMQFNENAIHDEILTKLDCVQENMDRIIII